VEPDPRRTYLSEDDDHLVELLSFLGIALLLDRLEWDPEADMISSNLKWVIDRGWEWDSAANEVELEQELTCTSRPPIAADRANPISTSP